MNAMSTFLSLAAATAIATGMLLVAFADATQPTHLGRKVTPDQFSLDKMIMRDLAENCTKSGCNI
jgi:hypothetical protein